MSQSIQTQFGQAIREQIIYRASARKGEVFVNGGSSQFNPDPNLRCELVHSKIGVIGATATLTHVPETDNEIYNRADLADYSIDDHLQVVLLPPNDPGYEPVSHVLFEGRQSRIGLNIQADARGSGEKASFSAFALPAIENELGHHKITGRWYADQNTGAGLASLIESPAVPAVFNASGQPNMHPSQEVTAAIKNAPVAKQFKAPVFSHDDDPTAKYWTVRQAIASVLAYWLYGISDVSRPRLTDVDMDVILAFGTTTHHPQFEGFESILPEVDVHGLGVFSAVEKIATAAGFVMAFDIVQNAEMSTGSEQSDRRYKMRLWKNHTGPLIWCNVDRRGSEYDSVRETFKSNDVNKIVAMFDGQEVVTEVEARGIAFIEAKFDLKPLWKKELVDTTAPVTLMQEKANKDETAVKNYFARYVAGGDEFKTYAPVGRRWGIDCTGHFVSGYTGSYKHTDGGYNFVSTLKLNDAKLKDREQAKAGAIVWTKRNRQLLPLTSYTPRAMGVNFYLEVSEDGGASYAHCPIKLTSLDDGCGIMLPVGNLAMVNNASLTGESEPTINGSWWALMVEEQLRFRITARIQADHAIIGKSAQSPAGGSLWPIKQLIITKTQQLYIHESSIFATKEEDGETDTDNTDNTKILVEAASYGDETIGEHAWATLPAMAQMRADRFSDRRVSVSGSSFVTTLDKWHLGQRVGGLVGRNISFGTSAGSSIRHPNIVGLFYDLFPKQGIRFALDDFAMTGGV